MIVSAMCQFCFLSGDVALIDSRLLSGLWVGGGLMFVDGEFDPGSGRTLAACLTHASRAERPLRWYSSGERVSNTWVICPRHRNNQWKRWLMPDDVPAFR